MRRHWIALGLASIFATGCEAQPSSQTAIDTPPAQGLTLLEQVPGVRTRVAYREGERTVFIETRRAEETPADLREMDPSLPAYGTDVRITAADGSLVYARIAGDGADFAEGEAVARSPEDAVLDLAAARAAISAMSLVTARSLTAHVAAEAGVLDEVGAALDAAAVAGADDVAEVNTELEENTEVEQGTEVEENTEVGGGTEVGEDTGLEESPEAEETTELEPDSTSAGTATSYRHRIELWKGKYCPGGVCVPGSYHSSTRTAGCTSYHGSLYCTTAVVDKCNHGRCPGGSGMSIDCTWTSGWRSGLPKKQMCSTSYHWGSVTGHHNCNDDSHLQVINVRHNKNYDRRYGHCDNPGSNFAPDGCGDIYAW